MSGILKTTVRLGVIGVLLVAGAAIVFGPARVHSVCDKVSSDVEAWLQSGAENPATLRTQLRELEREYPAKISAVRSDLAQLVRQIHQLERHRDLAARVVELAGEDLARPVKARLASTIERTRVIYSARSEDAQRDLDHLQIQRERLESLLQRLEQEYAELRAQIYQIERQVDAVARNKRLIHLLEKRNRTIEELGRFEAPNLEQLRGKLADILARQESQLELLSEDSRGREYERRARRGLAARDDS